MPFFVSARTSRSVHARQVQVEEHEVGPRGVGVRSRAPQELHGLVAVGHDVHLDGARDRQWKACSIIRASPGLSSTTRTCGVFCSASMQSLPWRSRRARGGASRRPEWQRTMASRFASAAPRRARQARRVDITLPPGCHESVMTCADDDSVRLGHQADAANAGALIPMDTLPRRYPPHDSPGCARRRLAPRRRHRRGRQDRAAGPGREHRRVRRPVHPDERVAWQRRRRQLRRPRRVASGRCGRRDDLLRLDADRPRRHGPSVRHCRLPSPRPRTA